jgi:hypothetical protein
MSPHLSSLLLERYSIGDVAADERAQAADHLAACAECQAALDQLLALQERSLAAHPAAPFMAQVSARHERERRRTRTLRWAGASTLVAAAAALMLWVRPGADLRNKGGGMEIFVRRKGAVHVLAPRDRIAAGDELQVVLPPSEPGRAWAWMVDDRGEVDALTPDGVRVTGDRDVPLPFAATIDAPCRDLHLVVSRTGPRGDEELRRVAAAGVSSKIFSVRALRCE